MVLRSEKILAIIIFIISSILYYDNSNLDCIKYDSLGSRFFPQIICIFLMILSILLYIKPEKKQEKEGNKGKSLKYTLIIQFLILTFIYVIALDHSLGFLLSTFIYLVLFMALFDNVGNLNI